MTFGTPDSFERLMGGLSAGEQDAAHGIYHRYIDRLIRLAARRLNRGLGPAADPESVAHSVFESFFDRQAKGEFALHNWAMLIGLLSHITLKKCLSRNRDLTRQKRHAGRTVAFEDWQLADRGPQPDDAAMVAELLATALDGFDADERRVIDRFLDGATTDAVAAEVGLSVRTVQRMIERFRERLQVLLADDR